VSSVVTGAERRTIPTAPGHRIFGLGREFQKDPLGTMLGLFRTYGDAVRFPFFLKKYVYFLSHPAHVKHIFLDNAANYTKSPHPAFLLLSHVMGNGLITSDGEVWERQRRLLQPLFQGHRIGAYGAVMTEATIAMRERWARLPADQPINLDREMMDLTLEIVGRAMFGADLTGEAKEVGKAFNAVSEEFAALMGNPLAGLAIRLPFLPSIRRFNANIERLDNVVRRIIGERRSSPRDIQDLLMTLIAAQEEGSGVAMDDRQLRDEVITLLLAGHETTADSLTWTFYLLSEHREARERLETEIDDVVGDATPRLEHLPNLPFTLAVVREAMRLYPPIYLNARWCNEADVVGGYHIPANSMITLSPFVIHRHPEFWADPDQFRPERFARRDADAERHAYLPFGAGPRRCLGVHFAMMEAQLVLATIVQRYRLELVPGWCVESGPIMTLRPAGGMPMNLFRRM